MDETRRADTNGRVAALLRDLAAVQDSPQRRWGYKRAAAAVLNLDAPIESFLQPDGTLRKIPHVGPSTERIIREVLETGGSATVERAVAESSRTRDVATSRGLRSGFLSRAEVVAALRDPRLTGPREADYLGDLQMHSQWSDGIDPLETIVEGCLDRGYRYCAVTDHSYGLPIARGVSMADLAAQHAEIDALNRRYGGRFRLFKGIEANIRSDGTLDMADHEIAALELVVASPHSALRSTADQTARMVRAVTLPGVHILGHPRGRMYGSRPGVTADWPAVFEAAARSGVAIEIDGDPSRQDIDHRLARQGLAAGCLFALDSDAHSVGELRYAETALAHARLAGVPRERIVNCWPLEQITEWMVLRSRTLTPARRPAGRRKSSAR